MNRLRLVLAGALALASSAAQAVTLLNTPITTAVTAVVTPNFQIRPGPGGQFLPTTLAIQATFSWGSGGTTALAWVQTSFDGGVSWADVCAFNFAVASLKFIANMSSATSSAAAPITPTDGTNAGPNKCIDGVFGTLWRVKYTTTGTYAATTLRIDAITSGLTSP
jgi:hypothetical protein